MVNSIRGHHSHKSMQMQCGMRVEFLNFTVTLKENKSQRASIKVLTMVMGKTGQSQDDRGILHITHTVGRVICNSSNGALQQILYFHQQIDFLHLSTTKNNGFFLFSTLCFPSHFHLSRLRLTLRLKTKTKISSAFLHIHYIKY